jgi:uncharacterized delta-60 repeat protein
MKATRFVHIFILSVAVCYVSSNVHAAPGDLDLTFNAGAIVNSSSSFISVEAIVTQPDGKILVGGAFTGVNGIARNQLFRLNSDGSLDLSFNTPLLFNSTVGNVTSLALQPDGKILVGGHLLIGIDVKNVVRLNANGSLDSTFSPDELGGTSVNVIVFQPDGKIIIGGQIGNYGGVSGGGIVRLNQNGSLDTALGITAGISNTVFSIALQADGKIIVGGVFVVSNPVPFQFNIIRMNANGTLDNSFGVGSGTNNYVNAIAIQPDGKILVGGAFSTFNGTTRNQIVRLNVNGSFDSAFNASSISGAGVLAIRVQSNGKIILGGGFGFVNGVGRSTIARLNADGSLDSFYPSLGTNNLVRAIAYQPCGKFLIGGDFIVVGGVSRSKFARLIDSPRSSGVDFDGDGCSDLSVFRPSNGIWYINRSTNGFAAQQWGISTDKLTPADYDGDGKTDIAVWRESLLATFYILNSATNTVRSEQFGQTGDDSTVVGDFDGDAKADISVFRNAAFGNQSSFFYRASLNNPSNNTTFLPWGISGDKALRGDFDGDNKADAAVFRPSDRTWYIRPSSNGILQSQQFGLTTDKLVPADYDGDGKADIAVFRPSDGNWYVSRSSTSSLQIFNWGLSSDVPVPGDYDGDGQTDFAVYRSGIWYLLQTTSGIGYGNFGLNTDIPTNQIQ